LRQERNQRQGTGLPLFSYLFQGEMIEGLGDAKAGFQERVQIRLDGRQQVPLPGQDQQANRADDRERSTLLRSSIKR